MNKFKRRVCIFSSFPNENNTFGNPQKGDASENREAVLFDHLVRSSNTQRSSFHTFSPIGRDFTRYQLEKNSREETKQEAIKLDQLLETGFFFFFFFEREREKKDRNMDATYFAKRTKLVSTSEVDIEGRGWILLCVTKFIEHVYTSAYGVCSLRERESLPRLNFHRKFSNTLIIGSLLSLYLIRNAIFVRIFGVISFPSLVCPPSFQQKLSTFAVSKKGAIKCFIVSRLILFDNFFL